MMEPALSFIAWMSVVLFQAIVQYSVVSVRAKNEDERQENQEAVASGPQRKQAETDVLEFKVDHESEESNPGPFYNDERNLFFELLEQTGSEMMKAPSLKNLVEQQITMDQ